MRTLITGVSGFIGSHLRTHLEEHYPQSDIYSISLGASTSERNFGCDLSDRDKVAEVIQQIRPDRVYHLAGAARLSATFGMADYYRQNFQTTVNLLDALLSLGSPFDLLFSSSTHVYGNQTIEVDEQSELRPTSAYGFTKYLAESALREKVKERSGVRVVAARLYSCIGPGQPEGFVVADLCKKISRLKQEKLEVLQVGPLSAYRQFMDVRDVVKVLPLLLDQKSENSFEVYNVASAQGVTIEELLNRLLKTAGVNPKVESSSSLSTSDFKGLKVKTQKLQELVGENYFRPLSQSLADAYQHC